MVSLLAQRTWFNLRLTALAHGLPFHTRQTRAEGWTMVHQALIAGGRLRRAYRQLTPAEREPLLALQMAQGHMPQHSFQAQFGTIRPYKPWRQDGERFPWKRPVSAAEKLWHLGMIDLQRGRPGQPDQVLLPDEVAALLPPLPRPLPEKSPLHDASMMDGRRVFVRDVAAFMAGLLAGEAHWIRSRWLTPHSLRRLNQRLAQPTDLCGVRSEKQVGRLRFLHYMLHAAGLIANGQPTTDAWMWLKNPQRWSQIETAIAQDLKSRDPLWVQYSLPPVQVSQWVAMMSLLKSLEPEQPYSRRALYRQVRFQTDRATFDQLLETVLAWGGWIHAAGDHVWITADCCEDQPAHLMAHGDALYIDVPQTPLLHAFVTVSRWAAIESAHCLRIDAGAVRSAVEQGENAASLIVSLADLTGQPLPQPIVRQIQAWVQQAHGLTLRPMLVLTAAESSTLRRIRADWRLRPLLGELLSPHHLAIQTDQAATLLRKLDRRGLAVTSYTQESIESNQASFTAADYLYLAVSVYRALAQISPPDVRIPSQVIDALRAALSLERITGLEQMAERMVNTVHRALAGVQVARGGVEQEDAAGITAAIQAAYEEREAVTIRYHSPYKGETTTRTIEPIQLYERNGARYVEAWCQLEDASRTFRLDRILSIVPASPNVGPPETDFSSADGVQRMVQTH